MTPVQWSNLSIAGAFILGAILATAATLHIVRTVVSLFAGERWRPPWRAHETPPPAEEERPPSA